MAFDLTLSLQSKGMIEVPITIMKTAKPSYAWSTKSKTKSNKNYVHIEEL